MLIKRIFDFITSLFGIIIISPILLLIILLVKLTSKGPILFTQERVGKDQRPFRLYKFRTMIQNADSLKNDLEKKNELKGPAFKMRNDPRLTLIGKILRKLSFDELPQLFNILKGDMSLVGPRPMLASEIKKFKPWMLRRFEVKPGITCIWQIAGRNKIKTFDYWMNMDINYVDHHNFWLDLKILLLTIPVVLFGYGAE